MTLYLYTKDSPNTSNCYDKCATAWPPLLTTGNPVAGPGIDNAKLGTTQRKDGATQVTYNGWPLYYYVKDMKAGDTVGQDVGKVWYVISPSGEEVMAQAQPIPVTGQEKGTSVMLANHMDLGSILVDSKGMTLYLFTKDTPNTSNCYEKCATAWPPLLTEGAPIAGEGIDPVKLGTTNRTDGTVQVTYGGWPLYYYVKDLKAGDVTGQNVGEVWFVLSADGMMVK
jgi:predicted lipoprotein with Yx(FWY)xxD motif